MNLTICAVGGSSGFTWLGGDVHATVGRAPTSSVGCPGASRDGIGRWGAAHTGVGAAPLAARGRRTGTFCPDRASTVARCPPDLPGRCGDDCASEAEAELPSPPVGERVYDHRDHNAEQDRQPRWDPVSDHVHRLRSLIASATLPFCSETRQNSIVVSDRHGELRARHTGPATAMHGGYANSGAHWGDIHIDSRVPARSAYAELVRQMGPGRELPGRFAELREM